MTTFGNEVHEGCGVEVEEEEEEEEEADAAIGKRNEVGLNVRKGGTKKRRGMKKGGEREGKG